MEFRRRKRVFLRTNIAPLVDVVFLLLLFFMLTSRIAAEPAIEIKLPESKTAAVQEVEDIVISITKEEMIYMGGEKIALNEILSTIKNRLRGCKQSVKIKADKNVSLGFLVKVVDEVKLSGAPAFNIVTERI